MSFSGIIDRKDSLGSVEEEETSPKLYRRRREYKVTPSPPKGTPPSPKLTPSPPQNIDIVKSTPRSRRLSRASVSSSEGETPTSKKRGRRLSNKLSTGSDRGSTTEDDAFKPVRKNSNKYSSGSDKDADDVLARTRKKSPSPKEFQVDLPSPEATTGSNGRTRETRIVVLGEAGVGKSGRWSFLVVLKKKIKTISM